jgi:hypothetical protein
MQQQRACCGPALQPGPALQLGPAGPHPTHLSSLLSGTKLMRTLSSSFCCTILVSRWLPMVPLVLRYSSHRV